MIKPSMKTGEGLALMFLVINAVAILWYLVTKETPPPLDYVSLLQNAKTPEQVSLVLQIIATDQQKLPLDIDKILTTGSLGGVIAYIFKHFTSVRGDLKRDLLKALLEERKDGTTDKPESR